MASKKPKAKVPSLADIGREFRGNDEIRDSLDRLEQVDARTAALSQTAFLEAQFATTGNDPAYVGRAIIGLGGKERERFWSDVDRLGTPRSRLAGAIAERKAAWVNEGLFARVRNLKGDKMLLHATVKSESTEGELPVDIGARHPDDE